MTCQQRLGIIAMALCSGLVVAKEEQTYYTPVRVAAGKENLARYEWAKKIATRLLSKGDPVTYHVGNEYIAADKCAAQTDDFIWQLQPTTKIPRVLFPRDVVGNCPVHGDISHKHAWSPWRIDPFTHPYQIQCMVGGEWYPSNRYDQGDMTSGEFPDDGDGCHYKERTYVFLREYARKCYTAVTIPALRALSQAYVLTGDPKYGRKGCILLARVASEYPNYGWEGELSHLENRFERTFCGTYKNHHPHYKWKHGGMITDLIWGTFCIEAMAYAYDGLFPYMEEDPEMIEFLRAKGMPVRNATELRAYIETYILRAGMVALLKEEVKGNEGFHQAAALALALVLDDYDGVHPNSTDMIDYAYHGVGQAVTLLDNGLHRDGGGHESPNYSRIKFDLIRVARLMEEARARTGDRFPAERYPDLFAGPKARAMFDYYIDMVGADCTWPAIGDCNGIRAPLRRTKLLASLVPVPNLYAVRKYGDPRHARACLNEDGTLRSGEFWEPYPEKEIRDLLKRPESKIRRTTRLVDGYGTAFLRSGEQPNVRELMLNYSSLAGHRQVDQLHIELYARGVQLIPDLGYPKRWDYRWQYDVNSLLHNTVTIDETQAPRAGVGMARLIASGSGVQVVAAGHNNYADAKLPGSPGQSASVYERTCVMVDVSPEHSYVVDVFAVNGGGQHDQSWHGMLVPPEPPALDWQEQAKGTLAGKEVAEFAKWTDKWGRERNDAPSYITEVKRARLDAPARWVWRSGLPEGDGLALHIVPMGGPVEIIGGRGRTPVRKKLDLFFVRRNVENGARSLFVSVLDPFVKTPNVLKVERVSEEPLTLRVTHARGTDVVRIHIPDGSSMDPAPRELGVQVERANGTGLRVGTIPGLEGPGYDRARVLAVEHEAASAVIDCSAELDTRFRVGTHVRVYGTARSVMMKVKSATRTEAGLRLTFDQSPLVARGVVQTAGKEGVQLDAKLFLRYHLVGARATWQGGQANVVSGAHDGSLKLEAGAAVPSKGTPLWLWEFGESDMVELPRITSHP